MTQLVLLHEGGMARSRWSLLNRCAHGARLGRRTFASTLNAPTKVKPDEPIAITGYAQMGTSGLSKVQVWLHNEAVDWPGDDRYYTTAPWIDAEVLPPPTAWGGGLPE